MLHIGYYSKASLFLCFLFLTGCSTGPLNAGLPPININATDEQPIKLTTVSIINKANTGELINHIFGPAYMPMYTRTPSMETVQVDIESFFKERTITSSESTKSLQVVIHKADSYWRWGGASRIPIIGIAFVAVDYEFGLNLNISFEVENNGKIVNIYTFKDTITIKGKAMTQDDMKTSYKKLISKYREVLLTELDTEFIRRYL